MTVATRDRVRLDERPAADAPLRLTAAGIEADDRLFSGLQLDFAERRSVLLPRFVNGVVLDELAARADAASFLPKTEGSDDDRFGCVQALPRTDPLLFLFHFLLNRPVLFKAIERITGCEPIGNFVGRLHRTAAGSGEHIDWHGDNIDHRLIGLTVNIGA